MAIKFMLFVQLGIAAFLVLGDLMRSSISLSFPSRAPTLERPIAPGDQTRRYQPSRAPVTPYTGPDVGPMAARLQFERNGDLLRLTGQIAPGDAQRFETYLQEQLNAPTIISLHSPGGSVSDALQIGRVIRDRGFETSVDAEHICLSACPYVFAGGTDRRTAQTGYIGVHQHYFGENTMLPAFIAVEDIQRGQGEVMTYLDEMGISLKLMQPALLTPPDEIYILTADELREYQLVTES
nr:hypothetical protein [Pseudaestuariivita rosea]